MERKLPIGIQDFEKLITEGFIYVDKTDYIYRLVRNNIPYFLSRPRRFGKSLLLSTMKAYWEGKKELFSGLKIEKLKQENNEAWESYPVFFFDFNGENYLTTPMDKVLDGKVSDWEALYECASDDRSLGDRFYKVLEAAKKKTGKRCVVLVDEYDKPLLDTVSDLELHEVDKAIYKGFFSGLKRADEFIQFVFITGVTKFHKVSIFSDLNQLRDISLNEDFSSMIGLTEREINDYFSPEICALAEKQNIPVCECLERLTAQYDGYRFNQNGKGVYNPYSVLSAFFEKEFGAYWYETGTPSFLVERLKDNKFDVRRFTDGTLYASESNLKDYTGENTDLVPLLYQTGYLTIFDYDSKTERYTLRIPNEEVKYGLINSLMPLYNPETKAGNGLDIFTLESYVENADINKMKAFFEALFAGIVYTQKDDPFEHYFQVVFYIVFTLLGKYTQCEMHTFSGRIDCKVETSRYVYLFEFKRDVNVKEALKQIKDKDYALPFKADSRKLFKIGVSFNSATRNISGWMVEE